MAKMHWILIVILVGSLVFFGCDKKNPTGPEGINDSITIKSVAPDSGLTPGIVTQFIVTIEYVLDSKDSGEVNVGFNTAEVGRYAMISTAKSLVGKGSGEHQFDVTVVTRDWGGSGDFKVYVNLSENPHGPSWTPLATDIRVLTFN
ncbi:hypothetical protein ACFLRW_05740 [Acidobacteriota bacterium]